MAPTADQPNGNGMGDHNSHDHENGDEPPRKRRRQSTHDHLENGSSQDGRHIIDEPIYSEDWQNSPGSLDRRASASASASATASNLYRQPACQRCRSKKIKCDALSPQCTACKRAGETCTIANPTSHQEYQRGYVESLEDRIQQLQNYLRDVEGTAGSVKPEEAHTPERRDGRVKPGILRVPAGQSDEAEKPAKRDPRYLGEGSGIGFINSILAAIRTRQTDINLLKSLLSNKKKPAHKASTISKTQFQQSTVPQRPPSIALGSQLLATYLEKAQVKHPFVARGEIVRVCEAVLGLDPAHPPASLPPQDSFRAFMVFAIASVFHYRNGDSSKENVNPMKYYAAAMQHIDSIPRLQNLDGVTNLLFIARLGFFCATGLSLWYISNLCLRICVENEMHVNPTTNKFTTPMPAFEEQMRRRVFWQCYSLDRHASQTLGRPFGIADEDVGVSLPVDVDDEELKAAPLDLTTFMLKRKSSNQTYNSSEMAFFLHNIKAKMITSRLNSELYAQVARRSKSPGSVITTPGNLYMFLEKYINELVLWRRTAPMSPPPAVQPTSKGFYTASWHDLHFYQEKVTLVRAIIDQIPSHNGFPPQDLLDMCFDSACHIVRGYTSLSGQGEIEPARGRLYRLFVAGVSVLYCLLLTGLKSRAEGRGVDAVLLKRQKEVLRECQAGLESMSKPLIDDGSGLKYVRTFEVLCREVVRRVMLADTPALVEKEKEKEKLPAIVPEQRGKRKSISAGGEVRPPLGHTRHASILDDYAVRESEFGGASPPSGYEKIHAGTNNTTTTPAAGYGSEHSPHSAQSWPGISEFAAGEIGEWFNGEVAGDVLGASGVTGGIIVGNGNVMGTMGGVEGLGGMGLGTGVTGVTGGYDYDIEGLGAEWANFLEILMDGR